MKATHYYIAGSASESYYRSSQRRNKTDWAGIGIADAYKQNLDFQVRIPAQKKLLAMLKRSRAHLCKMADIQTSKTGAEFVKMQIGPLYSNYPSVAAAHAALGLTCFLDYKQQVPEVLMTRFLPKIKELIDIDVTFMVDDAALENVVLKVTEAVQARLILEELSRNNINCTEIYRLFAASQNDMQFLFLGDIIYTVIVYGDVIPVWKKLDLHPTTQSIFRAIQPISAKFNRRLEDTELSGFIGMGIRWASEICSALLEYLPAAGESKGKNLDQLTGDLPPLKKKLPPSLSNQEDLMSFISKNQSEHYIQGIPGTNDDKQEQTILERIKKLTLVFNEASRQQSTHEDMRTDLLEKALRYSVFQNGPVEGTPAAGHEVSVELGDEKTMTGEIYDRPLELSDDLDALEDLMKEAKPLIRDMRKVLYPNTINISEKQDMCTSGSLDELKLSVAGFSNAIFKRYPNKTIVDKGGRPVLLIACDASGSLNAKQIKLLKLLTSAWIGSTMKTEIQLISGIYHSGPVRQGLDSPMVQWIYHPKKTPAQHPGDAARAIISLPLSGTGTQHDSLSITYMVEEAASLAKNRMIYLVLLSDCMWNQSFKTQKNGQEEVAAMFEQLNKKYKNRLDTTLIGLGVNVRQPVFDIVDKVILISHQELDMPETIAKRINLYVANCLKERRNN